MVNARQEAKKERSLSLIRAACKKEEAKPGSSERQDILDCALTDSKFGSSGLRKLSEELKMKQELLAHAKAWRT